MLGGECDVITHALVHDIHETLIFICYMVHCSIPPSPGLLAI